MPILDVSGLTFTYPGAALPALKDITFQVESGQLVAVVGANGAGKSSLCLALAGLIPALYHGQMQGQVSVCGLDTRQHSPGHFAGRVGLVLQNPANQLSGLRYTVYDEVAFGLENLGLPRIEMPARIEQALQWVGLANLGERSPYSLSGGQLQRLALASILAMQPSVLILDEPVAMLDPQGSRAVFDIIQTLTQNGTTVLIAEHHLEWIGRFADRVIALANGEIVLDGAPQDVLASPRLPEIGVGWLRYTQAAWSGRTRSLWPVERPLPVTMEQAVMGFQPGRAPGSKQELADADSD